MDAWIGCTISCSREARFKRLNVNKIDLIAAVITAVYALHKVTLIRAMSVLLIHEGNAMTL